MARVLARSGSRRWSCSRCGSRVSSPRVLVHQGNRRPAEHDAETPGMARTGHEIGSEGTTGRADAASRSCARLRPVVRRRPELRHPGHRRVRHAPRGRRPVRVRRRERPCLLPVRRRHPQRGRPRLRGDMHAVVDKSRCRLYETWSTREQADRWTAGSGATWSLTSNALRRDGWTSADAAGLPILKGLLRWNEVRVGYVDHAIRFTTARGRSHSPAATGCRPRRTRSRTRSLVFSVPRGCDAAAPAAARCRPRGRGPARCRRG